jgi:hypothetical protein
MRTGSTRLVCVLVALASAGALGACKSGKGSGTKDAPGVKADPSKIQARAEQPPPATATHKTSIGKGKTAIKTANAPNDTDLYWIQEIDIDGDGTAEQAELLWDDEDKVLFVYAEDDVMCDDGSSAVVAMLACVYGKGNPRKRPAESGFYAAYFDVAEGGAEVAGLYGCTFDAKGDVGDWEAVVVDNAGDEIVAAGTK